MEHKEFRKELKKRIKLIQNKFPGPTIRYTTWSAIEDLLWFTYCRMCLQRRKLNEYEVCARCEKTRKKFIIKK